jgi:putative restriction endonuclease
VWQVRADGPLKRRQGNTDPPKSELLAHDARGGFTDEVKAALRSDPALPAVIATRLLDNHFPESLHPDILDTVGLAVAPVWRTDRKRDPQFRGRVLVAYEYRCAVCGFAVRLGPTPITLDAAHIRWHLARGPDVESNGLALCVLHYKLFDLGAFTLGPPWKLLVSDLANASEGFREALLRHHGLRVRTPQRPQWSPGAEYLDWHRREVFKGEARVSVWATRSGRVAMPVDSSSPGTGITDACKVEVEWCRMIGYRAPASAKRSRSSPSERKNRRKLRCLFRQVW